MSESMWHYSRGGAPQSPVAESQLRQMAANGQLAAHDMVWRDGMPQWVPAGQIPGLLPMPVAPVSAMPQPIHYYGGPPAGSRDLGQDAGIRLLIPVGRSGWAIAAGYLGLISIAVFPAPFAILCAIMAIRDINRHPDRHGMGRAIFGLIMGIIAPIGIIFLIMRR